MIYLEIVVEPEENTAAAATSLMEPDIPPVLSISMLEDGFPSLPDVELDSISPKDAKHEVFPVTHRI
jgi:hypothetical protein